MELLLPILLIAVAGALVAYLGRPVERDERIELVPDPPEWPTEPTRYDYTASELSQIPDWDWPVWKETDDA